MIYQIVCDAYVSYAHSHRYSVLDDVNNDIVLHVCHGWYDCLVIYNVYVMDILF